MRAVIIAGQDVQDQEFFYPLCRLDEAGYLVDVATPRGEHCTGFFGTKVIASTSIAHLIQVKDLLATYDMMVVPGGVKAMEKLRLDSAAVTAVREFRKLEERVIASICSGAQLLITANIVSGIRLSAYPAMAADVTNAGAEFVDRIVVDANIVSCPHYRHCGPWMREAIRAAQEAKARRHA